MFPSNKSWWRRRVEEVCGQEGGRAPPLTPGEGREDVFLSLAVLSVVYYPLVEMTMETAYLQENVLDPKMKIHLISVTRQVLAEQVSID